MTTDQKSASSSPPPGSLKTLERAAKIAVLLILAAVPLLLLWEPQVLRTNRYPAGAKIFTLTGIGAQGRWTLAEVSGFDSWWKSFPKAEIRVGEGDQIVLRLKSADVTHGFYAPTLGIGPVYIEPGYITTVIFRAAAKGIYPFYCMAICGECHYFMRGEIVVGNVPPDPSLEFTDACPHNLPKPTGGNPFETGKFLFQTMGCITCHGEGGRGGQRDPNYIKSTVPDLNKLALRLSIESKEDAGLIVEQLEKGRNADDMEAMLDLPRKSVVIAKYRTVRDVIRLGRPVARADTTSFSPPLFMPAWGSKLSDRDIDDILIYLFSIQVYEESE